MLPLEKYTSEVGPFTRNYPNNDQKYVVYWERRTGFKQAYPYDLNTVYNLDIYTLISGISNGASWSWTALNSREVDDAKNQARKRFVGKLGDASQWGSTLTSERVKTFSSLVDIVTRVGRAARYVRRMEFLMAANVLGLPYNETTIKRTIKRKVYVSRKNGLGRRLVRKRHTITQTRFSFGTGRDYAVNLANGWLMFSYGVKPLMDDIYNSADALQRPLEERKVKASGHAKGREAVSYPRSYDVRSRNVKVFCSAYVSVKNPNLWLANQMGLINPVQMVNEGIPFSFVADWFSNLSQFIQQFTDFVGLSIEKPCMTVIAEGFESYVPVGHTANWPYAKQHTNVRRTLILPSVKLRFSPERFELQRGLNAISLLIGFLPKKH